MSILKVVVILVLLVALGFLGYYGYTLIKLVPTQTPNVLPPPSIDAPELCRFEGEDIYNKNLYTYDGKNITDEDFTVKCSDCSQYILKDEEGCVNYKYEEEYEGVCLAQIGISQKCPPGIK